MFKKKGESAKNIKEEYILAPRIMADNSNREEPSTQVEPPSGDTIEAGDGTLDPTKPTEEQDKSDESEKEPSEKPGEESKMNTEESSVAKKLKSDPNTETSGTADPEVQESEATAGVSGASLPDDPLPTTKSSDSCHVFSEEWSQLPKDVIIDKIKGIIYGQAIGDALGLATEFMSHKMAKDYYGKKGPSKYSDIVQDFHRSRWQQGDWTDDTDQMLLILLMIVQSSGQVDKLDFARRIQDWMNHGFKELGDYGGMGIGSTVHQTLVHPLFLKEPHTAAKEVWEKSGRYLAANGAIMRTAILGALNFNDIAKVVSNTVEICKVTHADPRCSASCIAVTTAIALMLQGKFNPTDKHQLKNLVEASLKEANHVLEHEDQQQELKKHVMASSLEKLKLDDKHTIGYTFKALGAGFYGLRNAKDFRKPILEVIMQAGDADSNAAVAGALVGCKLGFSSLPQDLLQFPHREWLDQRVDSFLEVTGLKDKSSVASP